MEILWKNILWINKGTIIVKTIPSSIRYHTILMRDGVYCVLHYGALMGTSHYKWAHNI